ncbi:O-antigen ligase family protein [Pseudomonas sp. Hp2]|uniref:O-antigen ligase family protein n=1 Tax=Pseudomonas sp. Hp2 TaxID=701189 RepID=UPI00112CF446|nr:hypothetical protein [Pseudomonas sp. Hp2]
MRKLPLVQIMFFLFVIAGSFMGLSAIINFVYLPLAFILGLYLFRVSSPHYLGFCMWLWMLTPLVRRVVDFNTTYHAESLVMLAPFLGSCIAAMSIPKLLRKRISAYVLPYLGIIAIVLWGFVIGLFQSGLFAAAYAALTWLGPIFIALHILSHPELIEVNTSQIFKAFEWGVLIIGVYGLYQFFFYPAWDDYWVTNSAMGAIGFAEAGNVRLFSTMNSPGVFALFLTAGLITILPKQGIFKNIVFSVGLAALMLSLVRSAWLCFLMGFVFILFAISWKRRIRYVFGALVLAVVSLPLLLIGPIANQIQSRLQTFNNLSQDASFQSRSNLYDQFSQFASGSLSGNGLGSTGAASKLSSSDYSSLDSGLLDLIYTFGLSSIAFFLCLLGVAYFCFRKRNNGIHAQTAIAITFALIFQLLIANILYAPTGVLFFVFSSIAMLHGRQCIESALLSSDPRYPDFKLFRNIERTRL